MCVNSKTLREALHKPLRVFQCHGKAGEQVCKEKKHVGKTHPVSLSLVVSFLMLCGGE